MRTALLFVKINSFVFSFDLHAAYHHFELSFLHTKFVGFFQDFRRYTLFSVFLALPVGLTSAPCIFIKISWPMINKSREDGQCVIMYLDNDLGFSQTFESVNFVNISSHPCLISFYL